MDCRPPREVAFAGRPCREHGREPIRPMTGGQEGTCDGARPPKALRLDGTRRVPQRADARQADAHARLGADAPGRGAEFGAQRTGDRAATPGAQRGSANAADAVRPEGQASDPEQVHAAAARGTATAASQLPHLEQIQRSFGKHDVSGVHAHVGAEAAASAQEMGAAAYATGNHVVLGAGTDLHTVAHEAAHVVQQRGGVQLKGWRGRGRGCVRAAGRRGRRSRRPRPFRRGAARPLRGAERSRLQRSSAHHPDQGTQALQELRRSDRTGHRARDRAPLVTRS